MGSRDRRSPDCLAVFTPRAALKMEYLVRSFVGMWIENSRFVSGIGGHGPQK